MRYPTALFEILSPGTEAYDRGDKFTMYQGCRSLEEYVLVSAVRTEVQVFRRADIGWNLVTFGPDANITLESLGISVPMSEVYAGLQITADDTSRLQAVQPGDGT